MNAALHVLALFSMFILGYLVGVICANASRHAGPSTEAELLRAWEAEDAATKRQLEALNIQPLSPPAAPNGGTPCAPS